MACHSSHLPTDINVDKGHRYGPGGNTNLSKRRFFRHTNVPPLTPTFVVVGG
jgi:hypothetical protein